MSETPETEKKPLDFHEHCTNSFPGFPTKLQLDTWKSGVPGQKLRVFVLPDGKRVFILRGLSALDMQLLQTEATKVAPEKQQYELQVLMASRATLWTNAFVNNSHKPEDFRSAGAGLANTVHLAVLNVSDFVEPVAIEEMIYDI